MLLCGQAPSCLSLFRPCVVGVPRGQGRSLDCFLLRATFTTPEILTTNQNMKVQRSGKYMRIKQTCGAYARSTGNPCQAKALTNGRCKNHGGMSTGPNTPEGRQAIAIATRQRMASGQQERVLAGFYLWLEGGGREMLSRLAKNREKRKRWERLILESTHASRTRA